MVYMVGVSTAQARLSQPSRQHERFRKSSTATSTLPSKERHAASAISRWTYSYCPRHHYQPASSHILRSIGKSGEGPERRNTRQEDELTVSGDFTILPQPDEFLEDKAKAVDASSAERPDAAQKPGAALESSAAAAAAAGSGAASSEGGNQKAGESATTVAAATPKSPLVVASASGGAAPVVTAGSSSSVALVYAGSGLDELTENLLRGPFGPFVKIFMRWRPPKWMLRTASALILSGQVISRIAQGKIHWKNTLAQLRIVGPSSLGVCLLTASFVGMVFTIQFAREFTKLGLTRSIGGVLALALARELVPVITSIILAGRVGSAFAAELGTMQVSQQTDTLWVLQTDPVDYLVTPRVLACVVALPMLVLLCFTTGMAASVLLADGVYDISANIMLDSAQRALATWDIVSSSIKSVVFGFIISAVSCSWGYTTTGGAKGVGESTTSAVVISLVSIFIADFILSYLFFQGQGDAIKQLM